MKKAPSYLARQIIACLILVLLSVADRVDPVYSDEEIGGDFSLTDQHGNEFSIRQLRGRYVLLYFGYLNCPDICPLELNTIARTMDAMGSDKVTGVFVTLDPERDTADKIREYVGFFHPDIIGLTGSLEAIDEVATQYKIRFSRGEGTENYTLDHSIHVVVLDQSGVFRAISPFGASAEQLVDTIHGIERAG